jgi:uncharacterized membrane protein
MLSVLVGLAGFAIFGVAMVMMKYGAEVLAAPRTMFSGRENRRKSLVWIGGCLANMTYVALFSVALGMGKASVISALNGFGLVVAALLSAVFLKERVAFSDGIGILLIVAGTAGVGYWGTSGSEAFAYSFIAFLAFCLILGGANLAGAAAMFPLRFRGASFVFAVNAGFLGGISALMQKIFMTPVMQGGLTAGQMSSLLFRNPYFWIFVVTSMASFVMLQVAYQYGGAIQVVPTFSAAIILTPFFGAILAFRERWVLAQGLAVVLILVGIYFLAGYKKQVSREPGIEGAE